MKSQSGRCLLATAAVVFLIGLALIVAAAVLPSDVHTDLTDAIHQDFDLVPGSDAFKSWASSSDPNAVFIQVDLRAFNVLNPGEVVYNNSKPSLQEVGPYSFHLANEMLDNKWLEDGDIIDHVYWEYYVPHNLDPAFFTLNITTPRTAMALLTGQGLSIELIAGLLKSKNVTVEDITFTTQPVKDILFYGYHDDLLLDLILELNKAFHMKLSPSLADIPGFVTNVTSKEEAMATQGRDQIYTGKHTTYRAREYVTWNDQPSLQCCSQVPCGAGNWEKPVAAWNVTSTSANRIRGTEGNQFRAGVERTDTLPVFVDEMFRTFDIVYQKDVELKGITLYRFGLSPESLYNVTLNPDNAAYGIVGPSGMQPIGQCSEGIPLYISKPHFLDVSSDVLNDVVMTPPDAAIHDSTIDVEPTTGAPFNVAERLQLSLHLDWFPALKHLYMPLFWLDKHGSLTDHDADKFKSSVYFARDLQHDTRLAGYIAGPILIVGAIVLSVVGCKRFKRHVASVSPLEDVLSAGSYTNLGE